MDLILQTGRKYNVTMIHTSHNACAGAYTKLILNEAHSTTFFINGMSNVAMKYLCNPYLGLSLNQIDLLKKMKTRWVTVFKTCPEILMTQKMMVFTNDLGSDSKPVVGGSTDAIEDTTNDKEAEPEMINVKTIKKYKCECGAMIRIDNKKRHESAPRHKNSIMQSAFSLVFNFAFYAYSGSPYCIYFGSPFLPMIFAIKYDSKLFLIPKI